MITKALIHTPVTDLPFDFCRELKKERGENVKNKFKDFPLIGYDFSLVMDEHMSEFTESCKNCN
jgi:hypothetical protein